MDEAYDPFAHIAARSLYLNPLAIGTYASDQVLENDQLSESAITILATEPAAIALHLGTRWRFLSSNAQTWNVSVALLSLDDDRVPRDLRRCDQCNLSPTAALPLPTPPIRR